MSVFQISLKDTSHYPDIFTIRDTDKILTPEVEQRLEELTGHHPPSLQPIHSYAKVLDLSCKIFYHVYEYPPAIEGALMHYEVKLLPEATDFLSVYIRSTKIPTRPHAASLGYEVEVFVANYAPIRLPDGVNYSPLMRLSIDKEELPVVNWSCVMPEKPQREPLFYLDLSEVFTADADPAIKEQFATRIAEYYGRTMENLHEYLKDLRDAEGEPYAIYRPYLTLLPEEKLLQLCKVLIDLDNDTALSSGDHDFAVQYEAKDFVLDSLTFHKDPYGNSLVVGLSKIVKGTFVSQTLEISSQEIKVLSETLRHPTPEEVSLRASTPVETPFIPIDYEETPTPNRSMCSRFLGKTPQRGRSAYF